MEDKIVNKVASSKLKTIDLEDFYPSGERIVFDIADWLFEGLILREKDFREKAKNHNWEQYKDAYVSLACSSDAIIPSWAYSLLAVYLNPHVKKVVVGDLKLLETVVYQEIINDFDVLQFKDLPVIIKGCSNKPIPESAYVFLLMKLQTEAKSVMYGEACSTVPLFKKK